MSYSKKKHSVEHYSNLSAVLNTVESRKQTSVCMKFKKKNILVNTPA